MATDHPTQRPLPAPTVSGPWRLVLSAIAAALVALAMALYFGGSLRADPDLPGPGSLVTGGLPIAQLAMTAMATITIGLLLAAAVLLPTEGRELPPLAQRCLRVAATTAAIWALAALATAVLSVAELVGKPVPATLMEHSDALVSFLTDLPPGRALLAVAVLAATVSAAAGTPRTSAGAGGLLLAGAFAAVPMVLTGHAAAMANHSLAIYSLALHVLGAAAWVGGLIVVTVLARAARERLPEIVERYSSLALCCFIAVGVSGLFNAWLRVGDLGAFFTSPWGLLVVAKTVAMGIIGVLGAYHRRVSIPALRDQRRTRTFVRVAAVEIVVMLAAMGLAVGLARTPPPPTNVAPRTGAEFLLGFKMPAPPSADGYLLNWWFDLFLLSLVAAGAVLYAIGVVRLRRAGGRWPWARSLAWAAGLAVVLVATCSGLARYSMLLLSAHLVQHLLLGLIAPVLLVLGSPATLALRTMRRRPPGPGRTLRELLVAVLHSRVAGVLGHPLAASALFLISLYGFYFTSLYEASLRSHVLHAAFMVWFVFTGGVFMRAILSTPPGPHRYEKTTRLQLLIAVIACHVAFGIVLLLTKGIFAPNWYSGLSTYGWRSDPLHDERTAAMVVLLLGGLPTALLAGGLAYRRTRP